MAEEGHVLFIHFIHVFIQVIILCPFLCLLKEAVWKMSAQSHKWILRNKIACYSAYYCYFCIKVGTLPQNQLASYHTKFNENRTKCIEVLSVLVNSAQSQRDSLKHGGHINSHKMFLTFIYIQALLAIRQNNYMQNRTSCCGRGLRVFLDHTVRESEWWAPFLMDRCFYSYCFR